MRNPRSGILSVLFLCFLFSCSDDKDSMEYPKAIYSPEQLLDFETQAGLSFSKDEKKILFAGDRSGLFNLYAVSTSEDTTYELTATRYQNLMALSFFPEDNRILYLSNHEQDGNPHIYMLDLLANTHDLTPFIGSVSQFLGWSWDHLSFYFLNNQRDQKHFDLYRLNLSDLQAVMVFENNRAFEINTISNDNRFLAVSKRHSLSSSEIFLVDLIAKSSRKIAGDSAGDSWQAATFAPDSRSLYLLTNEKSDRTHLVSLNLSNGSITEVLASEKEDIVYSYFSLDGNYLVTGYESIAGIRIVLLDLRKSEEIPIPGLPAGEINLIRFSRAGNYMGFYLAEPGEPASIYCFEINTRKLKRLTNPLSHSMDRSELSVPEIRWTAADDGEQIASLHYPPAGGTGTGHAVILAHDGPHGRVRSAYDPFVQTLSLNGFDVWDVNYRGSQGMGKRFQTLDDRQHGIADIGDCFDIASALLKSGDAKKIAIAGSGYGGYLALMGLANENNPFSAGIDFFGDLDWISTLNSIPPQLVAIRASLISEFGDPAVDGEALRAVSPLFQAEKIARPVMLVQGSLDSRVLQADADRMVHNLRSRDVPVEYKVLPNGSRNFPTKKTRADAYTKAIEFLNLHLRNSK